MNLFIDGIIFSKQRDGGISRIYREVLPRITAMDSSVHFTVYTRRKYKAVNFPIAPRICRLKEPSIYPWRWFFGKARVQSALMQRCYGRIKPDLFHTTYFTLPATRCSPYIVSIYDMMDEIYAPIIQRQSQWELVEKKRNCLKAADRILSISQQTTKDIVRFYQIKEDKIETIYLGVGPQFRPLDDEAAEKAFRAKYDLSRPFFLYVGNRRFIKNFLKLLKAYSMFKCRDDIDLVAVGGEESFTKDELILTNELAPHVRLLPWLSDEELVLAYNTALAFVYPSLYEGFGLPILEAMACGTPVLASNVASVPEVGGGAVQYFHPQDLDDIKDALEAILDADKRQELSKKGRERARLFSWDETALRTLAVYRELG